MGFNASACLLTLQRCWSVRPAGCRDKLFCSLTCQVMNKTVDNVRKHMKGRRFIQAKGETLQLWMGAASSGCLCLHKSRGCQHVCLAPTCSLHWLKRQLFKLSSPV